MTPLFVLLDLALFAVPTQNGLGRDGLGRECRLGLARAPLVRLARNHLPRVVVVV